MVINTSCFQSSQDYCYETKGIKALELFCGILLKNYPQCLDRVASGQENMDTCNSYLISCSYYYDVKKKCENKSDLPIPFVY